MKGFWIWLDLNRFIFVQSNWSKLNFTHRFFLLCAYSIYSLKVPELKSLFAQKNYRSVQDSHNYWQSILHKTTWKNKALFTHSLRPNQLYSPHNLERSSNRAHNITMEADRVVLSQFERRKNKNGQENRENICRGSNVRTQKKIFIQPSRFLDKHSLAYTCPSKNVRIIRERTRA